MKKQLEKQPQPEKQLAEQLEEQPQMEKQLVEQLEKQQAELQTGATPSTVEKQLTEPLFAEISGNWTIREASDMIKL
jgi:DNA-binding transcriptional MerR regulator